MHRNVNLSHPVSFCQSGCYPTLFTFQRRRFIVFGTGILIGEKQKDTVTDRNVNFRQNLRGGLLMAQLTPHEALIYIMVTASAADAALSNNELASISNIVARYPVFYDFNRERLDALAAECYTHLEARNGLEDILDMAHDALPEKLYDTAYALAVEVAACDLDIQQEELLFLQMMRDRWELDDLTVAALERSARIRFRKL